MMQLYKLIRKILPAIVSGIFSIGFVTAATIGDIVESKGEGSILRERDLISSEVGTIIELNDTAQTAKGRMLIKFKDEAELSLIEHTKVYIDKVYYDPDPSKSKMVMRMALGTARFASGRLGMVDKKNIDLSTPTAQIAVRGTDFTTTIDELGRTLVILLPDENGDPSGEIVVSNEAGEVTLTQAYASTLVSSLNTPPTSTVIIQNITPSVIDNMFIVSPPEEVAQAIQEQMLDDENTDMGSLDADYLAFDELEKTFDDYAGGDYYARLDYDALDVNLLTDLLDEVEELIRTMEELEDVQEGSSRGTIRLKGAVWGKNEDSQYSVFEEDGGIVFYRDVNGLIALNFLTGGSIRLDTEVEGYRGIITADGGDDILVVIRQGN
jgi:hypothetical protein